MHSSSLSRHGRRTCLVLVALVLVGGCGGREPVPVKPASAPDVEQPSASGPVVDVGGAVRRPGVYRMPAGARVHEAIEAAGGLRPGAATDGINRAAVLVDGQQVVVGSIVEAGEDDAATGSGAATISINQADEAALDELPGIGPVTAAKIVAERDSGGPFASLDDLDRVPGIGPTTIESLREVATA
jgi:competence protein ComEA